MKRVYFIKPVGMDGPIKIGCSQSPDGRRETLATWSPFALEIVAEIEGDLYIERRFHAAFKATHQRREWFTPSAELNAAIAAINAGTFDVETLPDPELITGRYRNKPRKPRSIAERYELSARHRMRASGTPWGEFYRGLSQILPGDRYLSAKAWFEHRHYIEHLIVAKGGEASRRNWDAEAAAEAA